MRRTLAGFVAATAVIALAATACGGSTPSTSGDNGKPKPTASKASPSKTADKGGPDLSGETISVAAVWSGAEQKTFQKVIDGFKAKTGADVTYTSAGDNMAAYLGGKVTGGEPPDVAFIAQPGLVEQYVKSGDLKPLGSDVASAVEANYAGIWKTLGTVDNKLYGVWFDASNKSTFWYNAKVFDQAGISRAPKTWDDMLKDAQTLSDFGIKAPVAVGGADGWPLTDWFENIYIRTAGADMYDKLTTHEIPWTDPSVKKALTVMGQLFGNPRLTGGSPLVLQTKFDATAADTFAGNPASAMTYEGSFLATNIESSTKAKVGTDALVTPFPAIDNSPLSVVGGGDEAVTFSGSPAATAFLAYLATPEAAALMVGDGGFSSPNKSMDLSAYPNDVTRGIGKAIVDAGNNFRFDMSDLAPAAFGAQSEWTDFQDFVRDPKDVEGAMKQLEGHAAKAYK